MALYVDLFAIATVFICMIAGKKSFDVADSAAETVCAASFSAITTPHTIVIATETICEIEDHAKDIRAVYRDRYTVIQGTLNRAGKNRNARLIAQSRVQSSHGFPQYICRSNVQSSC